MTVYKPIVELRVFNRKTDVPDKHIMCTGAYVDVTQGDYVTSPPVNCEEKEYKILPGTYCVTSKEISYCIAEGHCNPYIILELESV